MGFFLANSESFSAEESVSSVNGSRWATQTPIGAPVCDTILSSKYWDSDTKTLAYQLRDYGPGFGRWLTRDPIGEEGGLNLFAMAANGTVNAIDPIGHAVTVSSSHRVDGSVEVDDSSGKQIRQHFVDEKGLTENYISISLWFNPGPKGFTAEVVTTSDMGKYPGAARMQICPTIYVTLSVSGDPGDLVEIKWAPTGTGAGGNGKYNGKFVNGSIEVCFITKETKTFGPFIAETVYTSPFTAGNSHAARGKITVVVIEKN